MSGLILGCDENRQLREEGDTAPRLVDGPENNRTHRAHRTRHQGIFL